MPSSIILTGATTGIGRATALALAGRAGHLILHGLEPESQVTDLLGAVRAALPPGGSLSYFAADFSALVEAERLVSDVRGVTDRVDLLVNNAARPGPPTRTVADTGVEVTFQTNYLAPVVLTSGLLDLMTAGRIVNVASATHLSSSLHLDDLTLARHGYTPSSAYAHSKLALVTYTCWLAAHRPSPTVDVVSVHPGIIATRLLHAMFAVGGEPPEHAAATIEYVASLHGDNGTYYDERQPAPPNPEATDPATQDRLHAVTVDLLAY
ncbi:SDR family NAD(P)-dependent oxidoreductase [Phytohabitans sp. ZYX-F-186]|uniref:SDR family NAD(P)-dependent oxidoreductase n=1 Tax=Phytohabitans maris TaxID=3071409 RepID=A0ABU0ZHJ4_9ACTN|nr:SDR family NAD(P)-dependent oxidoreductase [Phytohabitans sp. ZYX-F-186]MDQ7905407.1 SDR family NAD(P)-dependent oxidoreductase [Phytohabitans sp. ZYX-F-186]